MAVVNDFKSASILCKVAFLLLLIASVFTWISYSTTSWVYNSSEYYGLWRRCGDSEIPSACNVIDGWANGWWGIVQAFVSLGFFSILISFILVILYMFFGKCQKNKEVAFAAAIIGIATGVFYLIGVIIFAVKIDDDAKWPDYKLGYSFVLSLLALILEIVAGILMILEGLGFDGNIATNPSA